MRNSFIFVCVLLFLTILLPPSYGVYLEYQDEGGGRNIIVDFNTRGYSSYDSSCDLRTQAEKEEGIRRTTCILAKKGLIYTEQEKVTKIIGGAFTYKRFDKDFFSDPQVDKFIKWIEDADYVKSLNFLGVETKEDVLALNSSLECIKKKRDVSLEVDEFFIVEQPIQEKKGKFAKTIPKETEDFKLEKMVTKTEEASHDLLRKFKNATITCTGKERKAGIKKIEEALKLWPSEVKKTITLSVLE